MAQQANVIVRNQYVYLLENATINVFDCVDATTGQRDIYYIQKGKVEGAVQFRETRRIPRQQNWYNQQPNWRPSHHSPSSTDSDDSDEPPPRRGSHPDQPAPMETDRYLEILGSRRTVTDDELQKLAEKIRFENDKYKKLATKLGISYDDQERIRKEKQHKDRGEHMITLLKFWKANASPPEVGILGHALEDCKLQKLVVECLRP